MNVLSDKLLELREQIRSLESCVVAFSGGVDSTLVLKVARDVLGDRALAVTALSESLPAGELEDAEKLATTIGARHIVLRTFETLNPDYLANGANRCYFCKTEMYGRLKAFAAEQGIGVVLDGLNLDDLQDRRPGRAAAIEHGVISPLVEAGLNKGGERTVAPDEFATEQTCARLLVFTNFHGNSTLQSLTQADRAEALNIGVRACDIMAIQRARGRAARLQLMRTREDEIAAA